MYPRLYFHEQHWHQCQVSVEAEADVAGESDSDLDEEAALRFYQKVEERLKLKRKKKNADPEAEEWVWFVSSLPSSSSWDSLDEGSKYLVLFSRAEEAGETEDKDVEAKRAITYEVQ